MGKQTLPPRLHQADNGWWYVLYHEHGRGQRTSLRTKDSETAKERFSGWLDARSLEELICADPKVSFVLDVWFEDWIQGRMESEARYPSIVNHLKDHFGEQKNIFGSEAILIPFWPPGVIRESDPLPL